jgi:hypothetical protein
MLELLEKKLTSAIFGIKQGTKTSTDALGFLKRMKEINPLLAEDYEKKYIAALQSRKQAA